MVGQARALKLSHLGNLVDGEPDALSMVLRTPALQTRCSVHGAEYSGGETNKLELCPRC